MKKIALIIVCVLLLISLCGCSNTITEGEVYKKEFKEEHTQLMMLPLTIYNGKTSTVIMTPYFVYYPDRYIVFIKSFQDEKWVTDDFYVTKAVYEKINIGDMFEYDESRGDLKDEPYTKEKRSNNNDR